MANLHIFFSLILTLSILSNPIFALQFNVKNEAGNSPGGLRFTQEIGISKALQIMKTTTKFIWNMFHQYNEADRNPVNQVNMSIANYIGAEAITYGNIINVSAIYLQGYQGNLLWEFTSLIYHEMTHVWQWFPPGVPIGLIEGIADYTILKAHYNPPGYAKPGQGDRWDQGYDFTARFLEYCDSLRNGFVADLNKKMKDAYSVDYFVDLLGKPVDQLWREYKAKYGG